MKVSVVILNWNGLHHLSECLSALAAQSLPAFQTIVVDNASNDGSAQWVGANYAQVELVCLSENRGFAGGNAASLPFIRGEVIVLLNNDTKPRPDFIQKISDCAEAHSQIGLIAAHLVDWEGRLTDSAGDGCKVTGRGFGRHRGQPVSAAPQSGPVFGACGGAVLYRREMIEDVGFLDEDFFMNVEDTDLAFRAQLFGWSAWFCREAVVHHRISASQGSWSRLSVYYTTRNHVWLCAKNVPLWLLIKYLPLNIIETTLIFIAACRRRQGAAFIAGLWDGLRGLPKAIRKRNRIQKGRRISTKELEKRLRGAGLSSEGFRRALKLING